MPKEPKTYVNLHQNSKFCQICGCFWCFWRENAKKGHVLECRQLNKRLGISPQALFCFYQRENFKPIARSKREHAGYNRENLSTDARTSHLSTNALNEGRLCVVVENGNSLLVCCMRTSQMQTQQLYISTKSLKLGLGNCYAWGRGEGNNTSACRSQAPEGLGE
jgi:hypothetical protein